MTVWKDETFFRPEWQLGRAIHVIGCGSLGSLYGTSLARAGATNLHLWDFDVVEAHNAHNQQFFPAQVGMSKVEALAQIIAEIRPGEQVCSLHTERVTKDTVLSGIVLFGVDTWSARYEINSHCLRENPDVSFVGDGRLGASFGRVYGYDPNNARHMECLYTDDHLPSVPPPDPVEPVCAATPPVIAMTNVIAGMVLWRLGRWLHFEQGCPDPYHNFMFLGFVPPMVEFQEWV
ncbi:MAG: ThiF family adenylyltransferase [Candidatus Pacebacteria bacterium]|nr:ThiF family adenylyltransferase [Candidatus Paceibacterota bacterium]